MLSSFVLEIKKLLAISKAEFFSSVRTGVGSKSSWTKAAVTFAFRE